MTLTMLPPAPKDTGRLSDVFVSALGAIVGGELNRLKLPRVNSAIVVVVDGLGYQNLLDHAGHARHLKALLGNQRSAAIRCGFPSTTAASLVSLATGMTAGTHGVLGYQVADASGNPKNMLNGWVSGSEAALWQANKTISSLAGESRVAAHFVASPEYASTPFTGITHPDAVFHGVADLLARANAANKLGKVKSSLVYLYFAELDQAAHRFGVASPQWLAVLELIDAAIGSLKGSFGLVVTADHGIVDVDSAKHVILNEREGWDQAVSLAIGDPRALFCYGDREAAVSALASLHSEIYVTDFAELEGKGWVAGKETSGIVPDFVLLAKGPIAFYDKRTAKQQSLKMVGQHGSITDQEMRVPLLLGSQFS